MKYLLDTDACIWLLREREPLFSRVRRCSPAELAVASMTEAELRYGALGSSDPGGATARIDALLSAPVEVLPFGREAARRHASIRHDLRARPIGERDLVIASVAAARELVIVTGNAREFDRVAGIETEDWMEGA